MSKSTDYQPDDLITVTIRRGDLRELHQALEIATDAPSAVAQPVVGTARRMEFLKTILRLRDAFLKAVYDHDGVPKADRPDGAK